MTKNKITLDQINEVVNATQILVASESGGPGRSSRKLTYDVGKQTFTLWIDSIKAWTGGLPSLAAIKYNETDAAYVDYSRENMAHAGF